MFLTLATTGTVWTLWALSRRAVPMEERYYLFWGSRLLGGVITFIWRGLILSLFLFFLIILPDTIIGQKVKQTIRESKSYMAIQVYLMNRIPYIQQLPEFVEIFSSPTWSEPIKDSKIFQDFIQNGKIQKMLNDQQTMEQIQNKDIVGVLSNPKVTDVLMDETLMQQFTQLVAMAIKEHAAQEPTAVESAPPPDQKP